MDTLTERRQQLRDRIWMEGPEHFDISVAHGQRDGRETRCIVGHGAAICGAGLAGQFFGLYEGRLAGFLHVTNWHRVTIGDWNMGRAYLERLDAGMDEKPAQFWTCLEYLDQLIKAGV